MKPCPMIRMIFTTASISNEEHIEYLVHEAAKISAADGAIHYEEKRFLAELLQSLREHGLEPDIEF